MDSTKEILTLVAAAIEAATTVVGLVESRFWLAVISAAVTVGGVFLLLYVRKERRLVAGAEVKVEGLSIDSLNGSAQESVEMPGFLGGRVG